ncbi:hypothetical protein E2P81_ATG03883 [Venturia nashicola]|uniref:Uncharacterized protein n=1 Tax=Venturia nashicola TaxID=86259 RepID=A0A4Z1PJZ9_9PEZI|nr:hypothetical protein E6O75_ATG03974 [Venturia nashicola]TLD38208.1 hypothetical protein E2P81_ATG03883 [Venturia nashicola]
MQEVGSKKCKAVFSSFDEAYQEESEDPEPAPKKVRVEQTSILSLLAKDTTQNEDSHSASKLLAHEMLQDLTGWAHQNGFKDLPTKLE